MKKQFPALPATLFALVLFAPFALAGSGMLVTQQSAAVGTPRYMLWNGTDWSAAANANAVTSGTIQWVVVKSNPSRNETLLGTLTSTNAINVQAWNGTSWGPAFSMTNTSSANTNRAFDVNFKNALGDGVAVYGAGTAGQVQYRSWNGSAWSAATNVTVGGTGQIQWVRLAMNPVDSSNELVLVTVDANSAIFAKPFNGTDWLSSESLGVMETGSAGVEDGQTFDVAYEQASGEAIVVWANTTSGAPYYATYSGGSWSGIAQAFDGGSATINWMKLAKNNGFDNLMMCFKEEVQSDLDCQMWNGTAWGTGTLIDNNMETAVASRRNFDVAEVTSTGGFFVAYGDSNADFAAGFQCTSAADCFAGTWSAQIAAPFGSTDIGSDTSWVSITADTTNSNGNLIGLFRDQTATLSYFKGTTSCTATTCSANETSNTAGITTSSTSFEEAMFALDRFAVTLNAPTFTNATDLDVGKNNSQDNATVSCNTSCSPGNCAQLTVGLQSNATGTFTQFQNDANASSNETGGAPAFFNCGTASTCSRTWQIEGLSNTSFYLRCFANTTTAGSGSPKTSTAAGQMRIFAGVFSTPAQSPSTTQDLSIYDSLSLSGSANCTGPGNANVSCGTSTLTARTNDAGGAPSTAISASTQLKLQSGSNGQSSICWTGTAGTCTLNFSAITANVSYGDVSPTGVTRNWDLQATSNDAQVSSSDGADVAIRGHVGQANVSIISGNLSADNGSVLGEINASIGCPASPAYRCANVSAWARYNNTAAVDTLFPTSGDPANVPSGSQPQSVSLIQAGATQYVNWTLTAGQTSGVWLYGALLNSTVGSFATQLSSNNTFSIAVTALNTPTISVSPTAINLTENTTVNCSVKCTGSCKNVQIGVYNGTAFIGQSTAGPLQINATNPTSPPQNLSNNQFLNASFSVKGLQTGNYSLACRANSSTPSQPGINSTTVTLEVLGWYTALSIFDQGDSQGGGLGTPTDDAILFYANYSNYSNAAAINGNGRCQINFSDAASTFNNMSFNGSTYNYSRTFATPATYNYTVNCSKTDYLPRTENGNVTIAQGPTVNTSQNSYDNCGAVHYRVNLYQSNGTLVPSSASVQINVTNPAGALQQAFVANVTGGQYNSSFALNSTGGTGAWLISALSGALGTKKFLVGEDGTELWKIDLDFTPDKALYSASSSITLNFTAWNQKGVGVSGLNAAANMTIYNDSISIPGTSVSDLGGGNYSYVFSTAGVATGAHYLEVSATTGTRNISIRRGYSIG